MIFPLLKRKLILSYQGHIQQGRSGACDYKANYEALYAPTDGKLIKFDDKGGGQWLRLTLENGDRVEFAHLSERPILGKVKEGQQIGVTGNTGQTTSGPHLHLQVFNKQGKRVDPESYFFPINIPVIGMNLTISQMQDFQEELLRYSAGMLTCTWDLINYPLSIPSGLLTQDNAYEIVDKLEDAKYNPYRYIFISYLGNPTSTFLVTYYYPKYNNCISTLPNGGDARGMVFEFAHQIQTFYNANRGSLSHVEVIDSNFPTDELIMAKLRSVSPFYKSILLKKTL